MQRGPGFRYHSSGLSMLPQEKSSMHLLHAAGANLMLRSGMFGSGFFFFFLKGGLSVSIEFRYWTKANP